MWKGNGIKKPKRFISNKSVKSKFSNSAENAKNIKVVVRCRPLNSSEQKARMASILAIDSSNTSLQVLNTMRKLKLPCGKPRQFTFDAVFDVKATQSEVYENSVRPMVAAMLNGYNVTIFAYGQTGTGKTYTMEGNRYEGGIMQNSFKQIFQYKENETRHKCTIECSYLELYDRKMKDLLSSSRVTILNTKSLVTLPCNGLQSVMCHSIEDIEKCLKTGCKRRKTASTSFNDYSSRSHAILTITLNIYHGRTRKRIIYSKLNLVDLAGSENLEKSNTSGMEKECCEIKLSLFALNKVISARVTGQKHIPYRDSLLTQLLRDSLGGNSKTLMIANVGPAANFYKETLTTLEYANRAKKIKNSPTLNFIRQIDQSDSSKSKNQQIQKHTEESNTKLRLGMFKDLILLHALKDGVDLSSIDGMLKNIEQLSADAF